MEYASPVWHNSLTEEDSNLIESIQKRALKLVYPHLSYDEALDQTNLPSLKDRRRLLCEKLFEEIQDEEHRLNHVLPTEHDRGGHFPRKSVSHTCPSQVANQKIQEQFYTLVLKLPPGLF